MYRPLDPEKMASINEGKKMEPKYQPPRHGRDLPIEGVIQPTASKSGGVDIGGGKRSYAVPLGGGGHKPKGLVTGGFARHKVESEWDKLTGNGPANRVEKNKTGV